MNGDSGETATEGQLGVSRRRRWPRLFGWALLALLGLLAAALLLVWTQRRPIAGDILARELEKRGVQATYRLDRIGLRTQQVSNLVIGDPQSPDLTARVAQVQMRIKWNGSVEIFRIVARGVRLNGRFQKGRISWGQLDRLLPPPTGKPFTLPDVSVDVADTSISLATPFGPLGVALEGSGNLTGGFRGRLAATSPRLAPGRCELVDMRAAVGIAIAARRPRISGPLSADRFSCPSSRLAIAEPRFDLDARFSEAFERFTGRGRMSAGSLVAGVNALTGLNANLTFGGRPTSILGTIDLSARDARLAQITANRTRLEGSYSLDAAKANVALVADYAANRVNIDPSMTGNLTGALAGLDGTPLEPLGKAMEQALRGATQNVDVAGGLRLVNFPGGGAVRIERANVRSPSGARVQIAGGDGVTYYWPGSRIRIDTQIAAQGGGLPTTRMALSQPRSGAPMSGTVLIAPYAAGGARLAMAPIRFAAQRDGSTAISTVALLDGPLSNGRIAGLRVPLNGRIGPGQSLEFGRGCLNTSFQSLQVGALNLGRTSLPVCATGRAIVFRQPGGGVAFGAGTRNLALAGRLGSSPFDLRSASATLTGSRNFLLNGVRARLGRAEAPILLNAERLNGTFEGSGIRGAFTGADGVIGRVPLLLSEANGEWLFYRGRLSVESDLTVIDRNPNPRFYPLRSDDIRFTLADNRIAANGSLLHPRSGTRVADVRIEHRLGTGVGSALLDVPGIRFGPGLQPEELTRLTEGVVALVNGTVFGQGRIAWNGTGGVTSTGEFSTENLDLAAAFGPVTGIKGTIRFSDLLGLATAPGQTLQIASINPGILVEDGVITYQLLPGQLVRVQGGRWPFMGGELILRETVLNLGKPSAKRLTFEVVGFDADLFVKSFNFPDIRFTGKFDGVLPMIFDESGGRIVGGRLVSRQPGGMLSYTGVVNRANLGFAANFAFDALRELRYRSMIIRLDGDLAGEFATRLTIDQVALGETGSARFLRSFTRKLPLKFNVTIKGPFRALIATAKGFRDPTDLISQAMDVPLRGIPGLVTETRRMNEASTQTQTPVTVEEQIEPAPPPASRPNER
ncbi:YdbH domain-containing protein [Sphingomonas sp. GCM10030256]|uniref:intermembrane phospholipid transport protein YdbH family protein n=1 Tax=Sphingomonas sp. GCM10030256 TaxID=3273427 RepID=UPI0036173E19